MQALADARAVATARAKSEDIASADRRSALFLGGGFLLACAVGLGTVGSIDATTVEAFVLICILHAAASLVTFESSAGSATATQPVLVAALLMLPPGLVPVTLLPTMLLSVFLAQRRAGQPATSHLLLVELMTGWHSVGPALVLAWAHVDRVTVADAPVLIVALVAQFAFEGLVAVLRCRAIGIPLADLPGPLTWSAAIDSLLSMTGLAAVVACDGSLWSLIFVAAPVAVLALLARDRTEHLERAVVISEAFEAASNAALTDVLTGLANRRAWAEAVARAAIMHATMPATSPVTVLIADVDGLKAVNDQFGHDAGDHLIRAAASVLRAGAPDGALVARLGGDEFGILVTACCDAGDLAVAVRSAAAEHPPICGMAVSISVGTASCPPLPDVEDAIAMADRLVADDKSVRRVGRT